MNDDTKLILERIDEHSKETRAQLQKHGECLARLEERSEQTEKRLDRADRRATGISAVTGALAGVGVVIAKALGLSPS